MLIYFYHVFSMTDSGLRFSGFREWGSWGFSGPTVRSAKTTSRWHRTNGSNLIETSLANVMLAVRSTNLEWRKQEQSSLRRLLTKSGDEA